MLYKQSKSVIAIAIAMVFALAGCGGGGGGGSASAANESVPDKFLIWAPPEKFSDNTLLNPSSDLDVFEVYVKTSSDFTANDSATAAVGASDSRTGEVVTRFNLSGLRPFLSDGVVYYVSVRAVAKNGLKSAFSQSASFSF